MGQYSNTIEKLRERGAFAEPGESELSASLTQAEQTTPERAKQVSELQRETALPADVIESDLDTVAKEHKRATIEHQLKEAPTTSKFLQDPNNAAQAINDVEQLTGVEKAFRGYLDISNQVRQQRNDIARSAPAGALQSVGMSLEGAGRLIQAMERQFLGVLPDNVSEKIREIDNSLPNWVYDILPATILRTAGQGYKGIAEVTRPPEERRNIATDISEGVGQMAGQITMMIMTGGAGGAAMIGMQGVDQQGERLEALGLEGTPEGDAAMVLGGAVTGLTEQYGLDKILNRIPPKVRNRVMRKLVDYAVAGGIEGTQEVIEGILHNIIEQVGYNPDAEIFQGVAQEGGTAFGVGFVARALIDAAIPGRTAINSRDSQRKLEMLHGQLQDMGLKESNRKALDDLIGQLATDTGSETLYFNPDQVRALFQQENLPDDFVDSDAFNQMIIQLNEQEASTDRIELPISYLADIAGTDAFELLRPHMTMEHDALTPAEYADGKIQDEVARLQELTESERAAEAEVYNDVLGQLIGMGEERSTAETYALTQEAIARTLAGRVGMTPMEFWEAYKFRVQGQQNPLLAKRMQEVDAFTVALDRLRSGDVPSDEQIYGKTLIQFLRKSGGILPSDEAGEITGRDIPNLLRTEAKGGMSLDYAALIAQEEGYIPEADINMLLDALDRDSRGDGVYAPGREDTDLQRIRQDLDQLADMLGAEGVDLTTQTNADIIAQLYPEDAKNEVLNQAADRGYAGTDFREALEWLYSVDQSLDMSFEARMARARELGFDVDQVYYHGTGGDIYDFIPGTAGAVFVSPDPDFASGFSPMLAETTSNQKVNDLAGKAQVYPLLLRKDSLFDPNNEQHQADFIEWSVENWDQFADFSSELPVSNAQEAMEVAQQIVASMEDGIEGWGAVELGIVQEYIQENNFSGFYAWENAVKNVALFDPADIRSVNAAFDPALADRSKILYQQQLDDAARRAARNALGLYSAVEQAVLDMPLPQWKKEESHGWGVFPPNSSGYAQKFDNEADAEYYIGVKELAGWTVKELKTTKPANGKDIWAKLKSMPVKKEELVWLGMEEFLTGNPNAKFNRQQVVNFIQEKGVNVEETVADQEGGEENVRWNEPTVWDDEEAWQHEVEDMLYEYDNGSNDSSYIEIGRWFLGWLGDNIDKVVANYEGSLPSDVLEELNSIEDTAEKIDFIESQGYDVAEDMMPEARDEFEEAANQAAEQNYRENPMYLQEAENVDGLYIFGNEDVGYDIRVGGWESTDYVVRSGIYSINEAEVQADSVAYEEELITSEGDTEVTKWSEYVMDGPHDNYRELKLTLPGIDEDFYYEDHFPDRNIVAFLRVDDRNLYDANTRNLTDEEKASFEESPNLQSIRDRIVQLEADVEPSYERSKQVVLDSYAARGVEVDERRVNDFSAWESIVNENGFDGDTASEHRKVLIQLSRAKEMLESENRKWNSESAKKLRLGIGVKATYFIDEFQSDWHQQGRKDGYSTGLDAGEIEAEAQSILKDVDPFLKPIYEQVGEPFDDYDQFYNVVAELSRKKERTGEEYAEHPIGKLYAHAVENVDDSVFEQVGELMRQFDEKTRQASAERYGVPDAPFKGDAWISLGLKRAIVDAVNNGYEAIAWPNAEVLVERWAERYRTLYETQYNQKMPSLIKKLTKQKAVHLDLNGDPVEHQEKGYWIIPITEDLKNRVRDQGLPLFQKGKTPRGQYDPTTKIIRLNDGADLSTFVHESMHHWWTVMGDLAQDHPEIAADVATLQAWANEQGADNDFRKTHELVASGFEAYLLEGKAPTAELKPIFTRFQMWLTSIYRNIAKIFKSNGLEGAQLSDDARAVMDRLLATEDEIASAKRHQAMHPMPAEMLGLSPEEAEEYQRVIDEADQEANRQLTGQVLRELQRSTEKWWKAGVKDRMEQVAAELAAQPDYRARDWLSGDLVIEGVAPAKMSYSWVAREFGKQSAKRLGRMLSKDGIDPGVVATQFGYGNAEDLITALLNTRNKADRAKYIEAQAEAMMREEHGDMLNDGTLAEAAQTVVHNDMQGEKLVIELRAMNRQSGKPTPPRQVFRAAAERRVAETRIRDLRPDQHQRNEAKARNAALRFAAEGDFDNASKEQQKALAEFYMFKESRRAIDQADKGYRYARSLVSGNRYKRIQKAGDHYLGQLNQILEMVELRRVSLTKLNRRQSMHDWHAAVLASAGEGNPTPNHDVLNETEKAIKEDASMDDVMQIGANFAAVDAMIQEQTQRNYRELTPVEFDAIVDALKHIDHMSKLKTRLLASRDKRELQEHVNELLDGIEEHGTGSVERKLSSIRTQAEKRKQKFREYRDITRTPTSLIRMLDGFKEGGPAWRLLGQPLQDAEALETEQLHEANKALEEIFEKYYTDKELGQMNERQVLGEIGRVVSRHEALSLLLNWGSETNRQRVIDGMGLKEGEVNHILTTVLQEKDFNFAKEILRYIGSFKEESFRLHRDLYGFTPEEVQPLPFETPFGTFPGGYYPIAYDVLKSAKAEEHALTKETEKFNSLRSIKKLGSTIARQQKVFRPLEMDMTRVIYAHVNDVIHKTTHQRALFDIGRILSNDSVKQSITTHYGEHIYRQITNMVKEVKDGTEQVNDTLDAFIQGIRNNATLAMLGASIRTAVLQPFGITNSIVKARFLGAPLHQGYMKYMRHPVEMSKMIREKSLYMKNREDTMSVAIARIRNKLQKAGKLDKVRQSTMIPIMKTQFYTVDAPLWLAVYDYNVDRGIDEQEASNRADQAVRDAQGGGNIVDTAQAMQGGPYRKLFTNFLTYMVTTYNLQAEAFHRLKVNEDNLFDFTVNTLVLLTMPAILTMLLNDWIQGDDDDMDYPERFVREQGSFLLSMNPLTAQVAGGFTGFDYTGPQGTALFGKTVQAMEQAGQGELDAGMARSMLWVLGLATGLPVAQANRTIFGIADAVEDDAGFGQTIKQAAFGPER